MKRKLNKIGLYLRALYPGELLKKIEYKLKDCVGYFYLRNFFARRVKNVKLCNLKIDNTLFSNDLEVTSKYKIFSVVANYDELLENLKCCREFWRKSKIAGHDDVKIIWEYNRLQFLLPIAVNYLQTGEVKYKNYAIKLLEVWDSNNEFEYSLNWYSNLEVGIRAINIAICLMLINDSMLNEKCGKLLFFHAKHIYDEIDYSDACIPNNHVIGEAIALLLLSNVIAVEENKKWKDKAIKILNKYLCIIDADGVSNENSFSYQFFVTKMYILALCFIDDNVLFGKINDRINKSLCVLKRIYVDKDIYLNYGDNDDGFLYSFSNEYSLVEDIEQYYNLFLSDSESVETNIYKKILNKFNSNNKIKLIVENDNNNYISNERIFLYKKEKTLIFFNAKNIDGHAHNDSLSINLIIDGREILLDSGTFSYNLDREDRNYYRSREAHTTILFNENNAVPIATFRWVNLLKCYISEVVENEEYISVVGILENVCSRNIRIYKNKKVIEVIDFNYNSNDILTNWIVPNDTENINEEICIHDVKIKFDRDVKIKREEVMISKKYLEKNAVTKFEVEGRGKLITTIEW